ncbi:MAG: hypothetical protein ABS894_00950 [Aerococcus urinaeequi]
MLGHHIYLRPENAKEVMEKSLASHEEHIAQEARSKAFHDCTEYWKKEITNIHEAGGPNVYQLSKIMKLFHIKTNEGDDK